MHREWRLAGAVLALAAAAGASADELKVHAAGSLRAALTDAARAFEQANAGTTVKLTFGASGLLKDRLAAGEASDVFASANMAHPQALADAGKAGAPKVFARNRLCGLASPALAIDTANFVDKLLDPAVRVGTSTPKADPAGDYAWQMFERIGQQPGRAGAFATLSTKALQLTGGPNSPAPPADRNVYGVLMAENAADVFVTYCTNVVVAQREQPQLKRIELPEAVNVAADYGIVTLAGAPPSARSFVEFLLGPAGREQLARHGFAAP